MMGNNPELSRQDYAIIVEALARWAGNPRNPNSFREERAWELIELIGIQLGVPPSTLVDDIEPVWDTEGTDQEHG